MPPLQLHESKAFLVSNYKQLSSLDVHDLKGNLKHMGPIVMGMTISPITDFLNPSKAFTTTPLYLRGVP